MKRYSLILATFVLIAWILPQSLFSGCVRVVVEEENDSLQMYNENEYEKLFDISEDDFEIVFGLRKILSE